MPSRSELRKKLRTQRRALDAATRRIFTAALCNHLIRSSEFRTSRRIALYWAGDGEVDLQRVARRAWAMGKQVYLPVLLGPFHNHLRFAPYSPHTKLSKNRFGIPEPRVPPASLLRGAQLDLVLMPLVGCDDRGGRLGMGGGYYDRSFAARRFRRSWFKPQLIGAAFELQRVPRLEQQPWDVRLDGLVTERGIDRFG